MKVTNELKEDAQHLFDETLVLILAGGKGSRLFELTQTTAKPALEFGCNYRIIDFPLSNCVNSGFKKIGVVTQYKSQELIHHLIHGWAKSNQQFGHLLEILPASQQCSSDWYLGTADALFQNKDFIRDSGAKYVMVLAGDHIYKMDYRSMLQEHVHSDAELSVACIEVPTSEAASQLGVISVDESDKITAFVEKPLNPNALRERPGNCLASMGNYIFNANFLIEKLTQDAQIIESDHDFGKNIVPSIINDYLVKAYRFRGCNNECQPYWRDVGTIDSYWMANMALLSSSNRFSLCDEQWPIWCDLVPMPPAKFSAICNTVAVSDSLIANGCKIDACKINKSLLFMGVEVKQDVSLDECLVLSNCQVGKSSKLKKVIVARNCAIPEYFVAGFDLEEDEERGFRISPNGVVLITQEMLDTLEFNSDQKKDFSPSKSITSIC